MNARKAQRATISDVARLAGVSISTVSRVLNDTAPVADETVQRVRSAVQMLNFSPHSAARTLAGRKTQTVGLLLPEIASSFFIPTLRGIESAVREADYDLLIFTGIAGPQNRKDFRQPLGEQNSDGLIVFANQLGGAELARLYERGFPVVLLHRTPPGELRIPCVRFDNRSGVRAALDHLVTVHQRTRIAFLRGPEENDDSFQREAAYREALELHGLPYDPALVADAGFTEQGSEATVGRMLAEGARCDAIFTGDDEAATGAMLAVRKAGLRIPEDVAVIGFDDVPFARHLNPPLTTVRAPIETASYLAARQLFRLIRGDEPDLVTVLPVELLVRQSCGCT
jgi:DNA-binding LacI/PurR family transcriptional regulator